MNGRCVMIKGVGHFRAKRKKHLRSVLHRPLPAWPRIAVYFEHQIQSSLLGPEHAKGKRTSVDWPIPVAVYSCLLSPEMPKAV